MADVDVLWKGLRQMPKKLHKCVNEVKKTKGTKSAYAICNAAMQKKGKRK